MKETENILEVTNVCKKLKNFELQQVSFSLKRGYIMGFIGPNGAGKSTTIRCMMGLSHIDSGNIKLFNNDFHTNMKALKQNIGFVYDQNVFFEDLTVEKNKKVISMYYDQWDDKAFYDYIEKFDVPLSTPVKSLSKGTAMKFALAVALSHNAELIIMDEPTSGLDPIFRKELLEVLLEVIQDANKAIFFSTHNISDLEHIADYITFIFDGNVQFCKETETVLDEYVIVKGPKSLQELVEVHCPLSTKLTSLGFEAFMKKEQLASLNTNLEFKIERPSLEDIMYNLVKSKKR
ncbi:ABC transporter ATP-binding protein [Paenibacillus albidus]|uniref:ABC transporter ATP-binding protein n=1 Tax=Paenibacillus albidus TaxID=2041023 RepID=A0A917C1U5_9BACL|nr:ABC transporter ATP-binding protein [Paenibacillus albidus]GGF65867.1 ABC transporter ATP-binding protein [Paenibacillus albidus]